MKVASESLCRLSVWRRFNSSRLSDMAEPACTSILILTTVFFPYEIFFDVTTFLQALAGQEDRKPLVVAVGILGSYW